MTGDSTTPRGPLKAAWLFLIKHTLNRVTRRLALSGVAHFWIVRHIGRKSGKVYETPIIVAPIKEGFVIELTYGPEVEWHKNVVAAGGRCTLIRRHKEYPIDAIQPLSTEAGLAAFPPAQRLVLRLLRRKHFELMTGASGRVDPPSTRSPEPPPAR